jgi:IclR family acetate operon transcriptional repressor
LPKIIQSLHLKALTRHTITQKASLAEELERVRKCGYAIDNEELEEGLRCIGAPVLNHTGEVVAALSIVGSGYRVGGAKLPRLIDAVMFAGRQLSTSLGFESGSPARPVGRVRAKRPA